MKTLKNLLILFITLAFFIPASVFSQNKLQPFELNNGGPASQLTTQKMKIDLMEEISQVKDIEGKPMLIYESWVRIANEPDNQNEKYYKVFTLADTTSMLYSLLKASQTSIESELQLEVIPLTPLIIDEVLVPQFKKIASTKGEDTKENIKIFRKEMEAMMAKNYLLVRRFIAVTGEEESQPPPPPRINFSEENEDDGVF